jgi:hypothetical protein
MRPKLGKDGDALNFVKPGMGGIWYRLKGIRPSVFQNMTPFKNKLHELHKRGIRVIRFIRELGFMERW